MLLFFFVFLNPTPSDARHLLVNHQINIARTPNCVACSRMLISGIEEQKERKKKNLISPSLAQQCLLLLCPLIRFIFSIAPIFHYFFAHFSYRPHSIKMSDLAVSPPSNLKKPINVPQKTLMGPGPSNVPDRVLQAQALPVLGHLHPEFCQVGFLISAL